MGTKWHVNSKKVTPQKIAEIVVMVQNCVSIADIAVKLGETEKHVRNIIFDHTEGVKALQAKVRGEYVSKGRVPQEVVDQISQMVIDGLTSEAIAPLVGKSHAMVKSIIHNYTIGIRRLRAEAKKEKAA